MRIGMKEADGDRLHVFRDDALREALHRALVQRQQHAAIGGEALGDLEAQRARHQRHRPVDHQVIMVEALLVALLDDVAEALGSDEGGAGPLALDQRIGGQRRAVDEDANVLGLEARSLQHQPETLDDAQFGGVSRGQHLAGPALGPVLQHDVGEGAANVGGEFRCSCHGDWLARPRGIRIQILRGVLQKPRHPSINPSWPR